MYSLNHANGYHLVCVCVCDRVEYFRKLIQQHINFHGLTSVPPTALSLNVSLTLVQRFT